MKIVIDGGTLPCTAIDRLVSLFEGLRDDCRRIAARNLSTQIKGVVLRQARQHEDVITVLRAIPAERRLRGRKGVE